jgi:TPR repeat protein/nucleoside-triphosphatase THEP1
MSQTNGIAYIYNPDRQLPQELINNFVVRLREYRGIFDDIKTSTMRNPEQHYIVQGPRGSGKTTLLLRIYYEIMNNRNLKQWLIPIMFSEEQYHIRTLCRLWESVAELLEEYEGFSGLYEQFEKSLEKDDYEELCFEILSKALQEKRKKLVLFIDNIGDMLDRFSEKEHHKLREILLTSSDLRIVGASSTTLEYTYDYSKPFFDFFKFVNIGGLNPDETNQLLISLSKNYKADSVREIIKNQPERVEILRRLTGGIPRTIVLLFEIFTDDKSGDSFKDLEIILDRVTPLYKHRMDDLSPQQQEIVDVMALNWDAISVKEIAAKIRMESKAVSAQLKQLEKNRIIHKIETHTKNYLYQISERFFNIWYLMRHGRRKDSNKVLWLVRFMQEWCSREELIDRAKKHIEALSRKEFHAKHAFYMTEALSKTSLPMKLQDELIEKTKEFLGKKDKRLLKELSKSDLKLLNESENYFNKKEFNKCLAKLNEIKDKESISFYYALVYHRGLKEYGKAEEYYLKAIEEGNVDALLNLGYLYSEQKEYGKAEKYYLKAIEKGDEYALFNLGNLYSEQKEYGKAEKYYLKAIESGQIGALKNLAYLYFIQKTRKEDALKYIKKYFETTANEFPKIYLYKYLIWNNEIEEAINGLREILNTKDLFKEHNEEIKLDIMLLISKKQYHLAHYLFEDQNLNLKDRYRPIYYALMYFMQDEYPSEFKKMGEELKETVEEIIKEIKRLSVDYA